ncbi:MAG: ureidoglycolate lyase [Planctomycetes bacterium]|nr:ureidoglycolate lyase [Planctomycetota bacterium]
MKSRKSTAKTVVVSELSLEAFRPFGQYAAMINPSETKLGQPPVEFFRDMLQQPVGSSGQLSFSTCRVETRKPVIDVSEYHMACAEGILPLDGDALIHVAPATPVGAPFPAENVMVFRVPQGTLVVLRPGVWHHAPFTCSKEPVNVLIILPERTYAIDCEVLELKGNKQIPIKGTR